MARTQPHAAYFAFKDGVQGRWKFSQRTMASAGPFLKPLEKAIRDKFLPALFNSSSPLTDVERALYALPVKLGGLAIENPVLSAGLEYESSKLLTRNLTSDILASKKSLSTTGPSRKQLLRQIRARKSELHRSQ